ncbi:DinB family protein [Mycobacterium sp. UM_CSW]|uniref:DinB family protein n=1 Tax=Mycobacterium sp. UM_CSW TaxID=1370119 RepID=UPI0008326102|nr:DinB family protein [Mycobacterium sp. UM_CSW]
MPEPKTALSADFERARTDFHRLLTGVGKDEWDKPTSGTRWSNEQLLFHMVFGYMVVQRLIFLVRLFSQLPEWISRGFARTLNAGTPLFDRINYYGTNLATLIYNRQRMAAKFDHVIDALQRSLARCDPKSLSCGMRFPSRWDPYFRDYMTLSEVYGYPGKHYDHHRRQLVLATLTNPPDQPN